MPTWRGRLGEGLAEDSRCKAPERACCPGLVVRSPPVHGVSPCITRFFSFELITGGSSSSSVAPVASQKRAPRGNPVAGHQVDRNAAARELAQDAGPSPRERIGEVVVTDPVLEESPRSTASRIGAVSSRKEKEPLVGGRPVFAEVRSEMNTPARGIQYWR